jgi:hypothetical protein
MDGVEGQDHTERQDVVVSQGVTWDGWKTDGPLAVIVLIGAVSKRGRAWTPVDPEQ